jgi:glycosyltransferase involved in cell wall biosynthesis
MVPHQKVGYVTPVNPQAIADALTDFYKNQRELIFKKNLKVEKQKYSWDKMTTKVLKLLK